VNNPSATNAKTVWLFGNPDLDSDNLPLKLLPELKKRLPGVEFKVMDPNDDWDFLSPPYEGGAKGRSETDADNRLIIIDTVQGIKEVTVFTDLNQFQSTPRVTVHDFDLGMKLRWLQKLKKLPPFVIIGIPAHSQVSEIVLDITAIVNRAAETAPSE
jgi:hypothetical protein